MAQVFHAQDSRNNQVSILQSLLQKPLAETTFNKYQQNSTWDTKNFIWNLIGQFSYKNEKTRG